MASPPITRNSLILRLRDRQDAAAWREFVSIYEPVIYRVATQRGLQHADAMELVQRVLFAVARAVDRFQPDCRRAKFRTWLYRITHNEFCKEYSVSLKHRASGDSAIRTLLQQEPTPIEEEFSVEYRRSVFRWAADRVKAQVKPATWQAFWETSVEGRSIAEVAKQQNMSVGALYIARSRVMARLQREATLYEEQSDEV